MSACRAQNVYTKFERYVPRRDGVLSWTSGPKVVHFDRVEWKTMPDSGTATNALIAGEQDWQEYAYHNLLPLMRRSRNIQLRVLDIFGYVSMLRPNHLQPPFNNPEIRRGALGRHRPDCDHAGAGRAGRDQPLQCAAGLLRPGTPMASTAGLDPLNGPRDYGRVRDALRKAGYRNEPVLLMIPSTSEPNSIAGAVVEDQFRRAGLNVENYTVEFNAMLQRRNRKGPVSEGGWSAFVTNWAGTDWLNPAGHIALRGNGEAGYAGWATMPRIEELRRTGPPPRTSQRSRPSAGTSSSRRCARCPTTRSASICSLRRTAPTSPASSTASPLFGM